MNNERRTNINSTVAKLNSLQEEMSKLLSEVKTIKQAEIQQYSAFLNDKNKSDKVNNIDAAVNNLYSAEEFAAHSIDNIASAIYYLETASEY
ncbi:MAG: hypothetical protein K2J79_11725 [Ruminiclostridium sp.]|nr:hypothetical protein [Ruminiclostridium sp.]